MEFTINSKIELKNGIKTGSSVEIPIIGLGTWILSGKQAYQSVLWALEAGYRLIDTATIYGNERKIGDAIIDSKMPRDEIFVTTKVWNNDQGYDNTISAFERSIKKLKLSYVDLYLIHWPVTGLRNETWKALEKLLKDDKTRAIGVSNFTIRHLKELMKDSSTIPSVNQVEFSPFLYQKELLDYCASHNIIVEAYSPLTRARKLDHPQLKSMAEKYGKKPAQILIRWGLQHGIVEIPKSGSKAHIYENVSIFDFNIVDEDMKQLNNLNEDFRVADDPSTWD